MMLLNKQMSQMTEICKIQTALKLDSKMARALTKFTKTLFRDFINFVKLARLLKHSWFITDFTQ